MINFDIKVLEWIRDNIDVVDDQETLHDFLSNKCNRFKVKNFVQFFAEYCNDPLLDGLDREIVQESYGLYDGVENLTEIIYPGHLPQVGAKMFAWCKNLKNVELDTGVVAVGENAFERSGVEKLILPDTLSYIEVCAFLQCQNLTKVKIPDSVESIFPEAFKGCYNLVDVTLPKSVASVGTGAFSYTGIKEIKIPGSLNLIPAKAFQGCKDLTKVDIEDGVIKIGDQAFFQTGVTVLEIPQSVKLIGKHIVGDWKESSNGGYYATMNKTHKFKIRGLSKAEAKEFAEKNLRFSASSEKDIFIRKLI